jgi:hypothetical protein
VQEILIKFVKTAGSGLMLRINVCCAQLRVFVCHNLAFQGDYSPVLAKHSKNFSLEDSLSIGVDRVQRNFEPMRRQVEAWRAQRLSPAAAKLTVYRAYIFGARQE